MRLKIVDVAGMTYPKIVNADTGEKVEGVLWVEYRATPSGRVCTMQFIGQVDLEFEMVEGAGIMRGERGMTHEEG